VVADSRYKLFEDFMNEGGKTLAEYLAVVRQAILAGLENGGSDPFRIITGPWKDSYSPLSSSNVTSATLYAGDDAVADFIWH
jgi:hypothetical protein